MRGKLAGLIAMGAGALLLAGCGDSYASAEDDTTPPEPTPMEAPAAEEAAEPAVAELPPEESAETPAEPAPYEQTEQPAPETPKAENVFY